MVPSPAKVARIKPSSQKKEKPEHWCYSCNRKFAQQASLQRHNKQHHGQNTKGNQNYTITKSVTITETVSVTNNEGKFKENFTNGEHSHYNESTNSGIDKPYGDMVNGSDSYCQENYGESYGDISDNQYNGSSQNSEFYNHGAIPEYSNYYYNGANTYKSEEGGQHDSIMTTNYGEDYYSEPYSAEDECKEEYGDYKDQYFVDIPQSENTQESGSYNYEEGNYNEEYHFENNTNSSNGQTCDLSFQNEPHDNDYFETEDGTYSNYNGDWETNELNGEAQNFGSMEGVNKRQPNVIGSGGGFNCSQCTKSFSNKSNLNRHFNSTHCFPCKVCKQKFVDKSMMEAHYKHEHLINCNVCGKIFSNRSNLNRHIKTAHVTS